MPGGANKYLTPKLLDEGHKSRLWLKINADGQLPDSAFNDYIFSDNGNITLSGFIDIKPGLVNLENLPFNGEDVIQVCRLVI